MGKKTISPKKKLDRFLVECPQCGNVPPELFEDFNGYYYFDCDNKDCKIGRVMLFTKGLKERLVKEGKHKDLFDEKRVPKKKESGMLSEILREKVKGTKAEKIDWTLISYIFLLVALILVYVIFM